MKNHTDSSLAGHDENILHIIKRFAQQPETRPHLTDIPVAKLPVATRRQRVPTACVRNSDTRKVLTLNPLSNRSEHKDAVVSLLVAPDQRFFVTGSRDATVSVWDCARLERNVSAHSRITITTKGKSPVTCMCLWDDTYRFFIATENSYITLVELHLQAVPQQPPKYDRPVTLKEHILSGSGYIIEMHHQQTGMLPRLLHSSTHIGHRFNQ